MPLKSDYVHITFSLTTFLNLKGLIIYMYLHNIYRGDTWRPAVTINSYG